MSNLISQAGGAVEMGVKTEDISGQFTLYKPLNVL